MCSNTTQTSLSLTIA